MKQCVISNCCGSDPTQAILNTTNLVLASIAASTKTIYYGVSSTKLLADPSLLENLDNEISKDLIHYQECYSISLEELDRVYIYFFIPSVWETDQMEIWESGLNQRRAYKQILTVTYEGTEYTVFRTKSRQKIGTDINLIELRKGGCQ